MRAGVAVALTLAVLLGGVAFGRALNLEVMPDGYVLSPDEVIDTLGRNVVRAGVANKRAGALTLPDIEATATRCETPELLLLSNTPEILNETSLPRGRGVLVKANVPAGKIRVLASHSNQYPLSQDLILRMTNTSDQIADVLLEPRAEARQDPRPGAFAADATVGGVLARAYIDAANAPAPLGWHPPDGDRHRLIQTGRTSDVRIVNGFRGSGMAWLTLTTSVPLHLEICSVPTGGTPVEAPVLPRTGSQARGLFARPDVEVQATVDVSDGVTRRYVFGRAERNNASGLLDGGDWMSGTDDTSGTAEAQVNRGDFGGITTFQATVQGSPDSGYAGVLFVLVAGGRKCALLPLKGAKPVVVPQWGGLVLGRARVGETFTYAFTLPPNSWAPVYLLAVPVHQVR